ncbi:glutathione S-transferase [Erwinia sp. JUb26]|uniref:glutathione S-transferase n=1 Tax=Erwinia sp. JUb26 TaxID=2485126 RepID=UPI000F49F1E6|nr:glutathione S-transferase [Erwinia sp. JUb26]ROR14567.1 glutathione S-transferase [Erwinia sp. JUb26]
MKLIGMMDSPYVRRVAVSLALYGVEFESQPLSVFSTFEAFSQQNPVVKAPTLVLDDGTALMDSTLILHYFESLADPAHKMLPQPPQALAEDLRLLGLILAASEKAVQHVYEHHLRPAEKQHQPWTERVTRQLLAACREWDRTLEKRQRHEKVDQVAISSTVVWTFIQQMLPEVVAATEFPAIQRLGDRFESHAAFKRYPYA